MKKGIVGRISELRNGLEFSAKKRSPEILVTAGIVGVVTSAVMACRATLKMEAAISEPKLKLDKVHELIENGNYETEDGEKYTEEVAKKDIAKLHVAIGWRLVKLYAPSVSLGIASIACILKSNDILRKRNVSLAAAYTGLNTVFKDYRDKVVNAYGEEVDYQFMHNIKAEDVKIIEMEGDGNEKIESVQRRNVAHIDSKSDFVRYFTKSNPNWNRNPEMIEFFLNGQQRYANDLLHSKRYLTLNEVYRMLGFEETKAGMVVGWSYNPKNPIGDNYVQFDVNRVEIVTELGYSETAYSIDFNVDGDIYSARI